ncbi:ATP synthase gamma chain [Phycisphaerae bacterium RAS1]|nr:ATP synthase gamma chain [Phycisphaerae bacterium RAS1]
MAKARAITKRRKAVRNIKKITQTMQLIATARFQKCLQRATASAPYTRKLTEMIETLSGLESVDHELLRPNDSVPRSILLTITSNRGLCGSYNAGVLRAATERTREAAARGGKLEMEVVGKKGINYLRFLGQSPSVSITDVEDKIAYSRVAEMAERYMTLYRQRQIARVEVAYMRFVSVGVQRPTIATLLPIEKPKADTPAAGAVAKRGEIKLDFEFSPPPAELLARLIPESVKIRLYQYFNDAIVSEQVSRMVAMKAATDAAGEMIKFLTREYNRARQSAITMELLDIIGGKKAIEGK